MNGDIMKLIASHRPYSRLDIVERLRADLLSGDVERARSAAASVRASFDIRDKARRASSTIVVRPPASSLLSAVDVAVVAMMMTTTKSMMSQAPHATATVTCQRQRR
jgi:hypothetical protein